MGRIIATEHSSLDGVVDAPGPGDVGDKAWIFDFDRGETGDGYTLDEALASEVLLLGLRSHARFRSRSDERAARTRHD